MGSLSPPTASSSTSTIPPHAMPLVCPSALLSAHLSQDPPTRPLGGRTPLQPNKIQLTTNSLTHTHGSSLVRIGGTTVVCGVRAEILEIKDIPSWSVADGVTRTVEEWEAAEAGHDDNEHTKQAGEGDEEQEEKRDSALATYNLLVPNLSLDTGCSPLHPANSAPSSEQMSITQRLLSLLLTSRLVRVRDLEIYDDASPSPSAVASTEEEGGGEDSMAIDTDQPPSTATTTTTNASEAKAIKAYYTLYIDLLTLSYANSSTALFDAAWLATLAALKTTRLPYARWDQDEAKVLCSSDPQKATRLNLRGMPVGVGFGVCELDRRVVEARRRRRANDKQAEEAKGTGKVDEKVLLVDLEGTEEECCAETGCVVVDCSSKPKETTQLVRVEKSGGGFVGIDELQTVVQVAEGRWREWVALMEGR